MQSKRVILCCHQRCRFWHKASSLLQDRGARYGVMEEYGMTEIGSAACTNIPQQDVMGSVGILLSKNNFCIYDNETECELTYNEVGEICMFDPTVMLGYFKIKSKPRISSRGTKCEQEQSANYLLQEYRVINSLPLTANSKVDYRVLEKDKGDINCLNKELQT